MNPTGHFWALWPRLRDRVLPLEAPSSRAWSTRIRDGERRLTLRGRWREEPSTVAVIVIHGLGGGHDRPYCIRAARAIAAHGWSCLRLALRGADGSGEDFYHAGLIDDVAATVTSPAFANYERIVIIGYSLGGHLALRYACEKPDPRVRAVAAICAPLDLDRGARHLDEHAGRLYRRHLLNGLRDQYAAVVARGFAPTPLSDLSHVDSIREWDRLTICPRFGFASAEDYYATQSVAARLRQLHVPSLLAVSRQDPMISLADIEASLGDANPLLEVRRINSGGHVGFPPGLDLGEDAPGGLERQVLRWLERKLR
jgi:predicted alpha/beta-fold hydrolase